LMACVTYEHYSNNFDHNQLWRLNFSQLDYVTAYHIIWWGEL